MQENPVSVLLMDDEPMSPIIQATLQLLRNEGFDTDLAESVREALEAYYEKFYDVFVLDIDMNDPESDGIRVLKRFISLHNQTKVIMFSGAGTKFDWFAAANAHCFAYIAKDENGATELLIRYIRSAAETPPRRRRSALQKGICPQKILLYCKDPELRKDAEAVIVKTLGEQWNIAVADALETAASVPDSASDYGAVLLLQDFFSTDSGTREIMKGILSLSPKPQVIVGCKGEDEYRPSILQTANLRPFRMISLSRHDWKNRLEEALNAARLWYGKEEIFKADMEAFERIRVTLPPEALKHWEEFSAEDTACEDESASGEGQGR
jgi:CheY-like chemotaxis protein